jgi:hypothetical protein
VNCHEEFGRAFRANRKSRVKTHNPSEPTSSACLVATKLVSLCVCPLAYFPKGNPGVSSYNTELTLFVVALLAYFGGWPPCVVHVVSAAGSIAKYSLEGRGYSYAIYQIHSLDGQPGRVLDRICLFVFVGRSGCHRLLVPECSSGTFKMDVNALIDHM